jgi:predicted Zn-dependent protease
MNSGTIVKQWMKPLAVLLALWGVAGHPLPALAQNPFGQSLSLQEEKEAGQALFQEAIREQGLSDQRQTDRVQAIVDRIHATSGERTYLSFKAAVLKDDEWNAFALPGGFVCVNEGMILKNWEEAAGDAKKFEGLLAAAIAHESAHVYHRDTDIVARIYHKYPDAPLEHVAKNIQKEYGEALYGQWLAGQRQREDDADRDGMWYLLRAGYPSQAMVDMLHLMVKLDEAGSLPLSTWERTHSRPSDRLANVLALQAKIFSMQSKYDEAKLVLQLGLEDERLDQAVRDLEGVKDFFPTTLSVRYALGVAYHRLYLRSAGPARLGLKPSFGFYKFSAVRAGPREPDLESLQRAIDEYSVVLKACESDDYKGADLAASALGLALAQAGQVDESIRWCNKAVELDPADWNNLNNLGIAHHRKGAVDKAADCFQRAMEAARTSYGDILEKVLEKALKGGAQEGPIDEDQKVARATS